MTDQPAIDLAGITRPFYEYAFGIDTRDWDLYRRTFTDQISADFSSYNGGEPAVLSADDWVAGVRASLAGLDATQHTMSNPLIDLSDDGESARCRMQMQAAHFLNDWPEPEFTIGGYYDNQLVHTEDGWKISAVTLNVWWRRGDFALMQEAKHRHE